MTNSQIVGLLQYPPARGRFGPRAAVENLYDVRVSVVTGRPNAIEFVAAIRDEMRRRAYQSGTIKDYGNNLKHFLCWFGGRPHLVQRQDVLAFLLYLVDAGRSASTLNGYIAAIRTAFDRLCLRQVTLGVVAPRQAKRLPVVLSRQEIVRLLEATPTLRDKLMLGLMYASGLRVSEVAKLRYCDVDFDRQVITVRLGKGQRDRQVLLPETLRPLLKERAAQSSSTAFVFPSTRGHSRSARHISPRTIQRVMKRAVQIAGIGKAATPHALRHSFACHSFEDGCDIRNIQKLLGHVRLDTTTIYVRVARPTDPLRVRSPLDRSHDRDKRELALTTDAWASSHQKNVAASQQVGNLTIHTKSLNPDGDANDRRTAITLGIRSESNSATTFLTGIVAKEIRPGWVNLEIPPLESWQSSLSQLPIAQQRRIESAEFFAILQREIPRRVTQGST